VASFALYADRSSRLIAVISQFSPAQAVYARDELYQRAGVVLLDLAPAGARSGDLFAPLSAEGEARRAGVMTVMDDINRRWGRGTLRTLAEGVGQPWRMRRERRSPADTTQWEELLGVG
jgi:DNA polymerase V